MIHHILECLPMTTEGQNRMVNLQPDPTPERFSIDTIGGPHPSPPEGPRYCFEGEVYDDFVIGWPLPDVLPGDPETPGKYVKFTESLLGRQSPDSGIIRGAVYHWQEDWASKASEAGTPNE